MTGDGIERRRRSAAARFEAVFGRSAEGVAVAPGRVNLIGEHTDYNDGYVLPVAIDRFVLVAFARGETDRLRARSERFDEERTLALAELSADALAGATPGWFAYVAGVAWALARRGVACAGADLLVDGCLPVGAGLSSSAALELAVARALFALARRDWDPLAAARASQEAESEIVGVASGLMDQMAAAASEAGAAMLLDCRDLTRVRIPLPENLRIVVMDTGTRRRLAESEYNERRKSCEEAVRLLAASGLAATALRDATLPDLERARGALGELRYRRARHVVEENGRTLEAARALGASNHERLAQLLAESHASLRDLYEVSSPALDSMVSLAERHPASLGARMTGAGFGGAALALVRSSGASDFAEEVEARYRTETGNDGRLYVCRSESGVRVA